MPQQVIYLVKSFSLPINISQKNTLEYPVNDFLMGGNLYNKNNNNVKSCKILTQSYKRSQQSENNEKKEKIKLEETIVNEYQKINCFKRSFNFLLSSPISFKLLVLQFIWILPYLMVSYFLKFLMSLSTFIVSKLSRKIITTI